MVDQDMTKRIPTLRWPCLLFCLLTVGTVACLGDNGRLAAVALPAADFKWGPFLAPFHSVLLHYPIGFVTAAVILDLVYLFRRDEAVKRINRLMLQLCVFSAVVVIILGLLRASDGGYEEKTLDTHRTYGIAVGVLLSLTWVAQRFTFRPGRNLAAEVGFRVLLAATLVALVIAGHAGGNLTHGSQYLVKNAPQFVKTLLEDAPDEASTTTAVMDEENRFYLEKIKPLFETKCFECHGPKKQKAGYRLDQRETALKGGKSGSTAIKPGDPMTSNLIRVILLPKHHDEVMPPEGKAMLTPDEVLNIVQWIQSGAVFPDSGVPASAAQTAGAGSHAASAEAPAVAQAGSDERGVAAAPPPARNSSGKVDFAAQIQPIFEKRCIGCHGTEKQKGKLRLDSLAAALKGGSDAGPAVVPGKAGESAMLKRLLVDPAKDEDEQLMPPAKKGGPLDKGQIELIRRWIDEGAEWPKDLVLQAAEPAR